MKKIILTALSILLFVQINAFSQQEINLENCIDVLSALESYSKDKVCKKKGLIEECSTIVNSQGRATDKVYLIIAEDLIYRSKCTTKKTEAEICLNCNVESQGAGGTISTLKSLKNIAEKAEPQETGDTISSLQDLKQLANSLSTPSVPFCTSGISLIKQKSTKQRICFLSKKLFIQCPQILTDNKQSTLAVESLMIEDDLKRLHSRGTCKMVLSDPTSCKDCNDDWGSFSPEEVRKRNETIKFIKLLKEKKGKTKKPKPGEFSI